MNFKGDELVFYKCPECGKRRLLWKKESPPRSRLVTRMFYEVEIKEHSVICSRCHIKYVKRRKEIEKRHYQRLKEERRDDKTPTLLDDDKAQP
jgi:hypothetical protein